MAAKKPAKGKGKDAPARGPIAEWAAKGRAVGALIGFAVTFLVSYRAGIGPVDAALRGLIGGVAFSLGGWMCALMVLNGLVRTAASRPPEEPGAPSGPGERAG